MRILALLMALLLLGACGNSNGEAQEAQSTTESSRTESSEPTGQASGSTGADEPTRTAQASDNGADAGADSQQGAEELEKLTPGWMGTEDGRVAFDVIAAWSSQNNGWNFNGYANGEITVVVPAGWRVSIEFASKDGNYPHSLVVIDDPRPEGSLPPKAGREAAAFSRAYTSKPTQGMRSGKEGRISFSADEAGDYLWYCGVPGHGPAGMWVGFKVSAEADKPYVLKEPEAEGRT